MKKAIRNSIITMLLFFSFCSTEPDSDYVYFKIKIDKLTHPDTIAVNDSLSIKFDGVVGYDGCHSFSNFEIVENLSDLEITVWGIKPNSDTVCPAVMVYLDGKEYKTLFKRKGINRIIVHQPDNSLLIDSVYVQ